MTPETRYARTADGTHVAYQVHGDGPVDILVLRAWHSNLDHEWQEPVLAGILGRLGSLGRVIRLDRRGTGLSDRFDLGAPPTVENRVDDIRAVLDAVGAGPVVACGLAHGGALCSYFAATYPERTAGLVLWSPPPSLIGQAPAEAFDAYRDAIRHEWATLDAARETAAVAAPSRVGDSAFLEWLREDAALLGGPEDAIVHWELVRGTNILGILPSVHVPAAVLWRSGSPSAGPEVAQAIAGARAVELPGDDHMLISGDWRRALVEIERFVESIGDDDQERNRVLATVLFTDLVGSTAQATDLGDRDWHDLVERHHAAIRRELARHRGREIDTAGDGFFASFDGPARAIKCAAAIRSALNELGLDVRIGLHAGECERADGGLRGVAVHVGARVGTAAAGGEILVTSTVRDLVAGSGIGFEDAGRHELKGLPESWQLFRVTAA